MSEETKKKMLTVSAILFKHNVPVEEAKLIGSFIEELQQENQQLKDKLKGVQEERDYLFNKQFIENKYLTKENKQLRGVIDKATKFYTHELFKREQLLMPKNMPWESVEMFNILEGNK